MQSKELYVKALRYLIDPDGETGKEIAAQIQADALKPDYFTDFHVKDNKFYSSKYSVLFEYCLDFYKKHREIITDDVLRQQLVDNTDIGATQKKDYLDIIKEVCEEDYKPTEFPFIREQIEKEYVSNYSVSLYKSAIVKADEDNDPIAALDYVQKNITDLRSRLMPSNTKLDKTCWLWQLAEKKLKQLDEEGKAMIPRAQFGFPSWDKRFGGLFPEELTLLAGPKNSFKSGVQNRVVIHNISEQKNVVWATRENSITQNWNRLISFITAIPLSVINTDTFTETQLKHYREAIEYIRDYSKTSKILIVTPNDCQTIQMLKNYIQLNFGDETPDLIAIDHIGRLKPSGKSYGQAWENMAAVVEETKDMLSYFGSPGISPAHLSRAGNKHEAADLDHMQFDSLSQVVDNIIMCKPDGQKPWKPPETESEPGQPGVLNCTVVRARNHPKNIVLQLEVEPSVGMAEDYTGNHFETPSEVEEVLEKERKEYRKRKLGGKE